LPEVDAERLGGVGGEREQIRQMLGCCGPSQAAQESCQVDRFPALQLGLRSQRPPSVFLLMAALHRAYGVRFTGVGSAGGRVRTFRRDGIPQSLPAPRQGRPTASACRQPDDVQHRRAPQPMLPRLR